MPGLVTLKMVCPSEPLERARAMRTRCIFARCLARYPSEP
jgi:hypothetical protein